VGLLVFALAGRGTASEGRIPRAVFGVSLHRRERNRLARKGAFGTRPICCVKTKSEAGLKCHPS
jgi:hypothetical protein